MPASGVNISTAPKKMAAWAAALALGVTGIALTSIPGTQAADGMVNGDGGGGLMGILEDEAIDATKSSFDVSIAPVPADGSTSATITVTAQTSEGLPATGQATRLSAVADPAANVTIGAFAEVDPQGAPGVYTAQVTSTVTGVKAITVFLDDSVPIPVSGGDFDDVTFVAGTVATGTVSIDSATYLAVGVSGHVVSVSLADADGNPVSGAAADLSAVASPSDGVTISPFTGGDPTDTPGVYAAVVTSTSAGSKTITVSHSGVGALAPTVTANFMAGLGHADLTNSTWTVRPFEARVADGSNAFTGTMTARDEFLNPLPGIGVTFYSAPGVTADPVFGITGADGTVTTRFTSTTVGNYDVWVTAATVDGPQQVGNTITLNYHGDTIDLTKTTLSVDNDRVAAVGGSHQISVTARDAQDNPLPGYVAVFTVSTGLNHGGTATLSDVSAVTDANGVAIVTLTSNDEDEYVVSATINSASVVGSPQTVAFTSGSPTTSSSYLDLAKTNSSASTVVADGSQSWTVRVMVQDGLGAGLPGAAVDFVADAGVVLSAPFAISDGSGWAAVTATSTTAGIYSVNATLGGLGVLGTPGTIVFSAGAPDASRSTINASPVSVVANGQTVHTVTVTLRDAMDNPIPGLTPNITADAALTLQSQSGSVTNSDGRIVYSYTATTPSTGTGFAVSARINSTEILRSPARLQFRAGDPDLADSTLVLSAKSAAVGGSVTATVTLLDALNNLVSGVEVSFTVSNSGVLSDDMCVTGVAGTCAVLVTDSIPEQISVRASVTQGALTGSPSTVVFSARPLSGSVSKFVVARTNTSALSVLADGSSSWTATLTAKDAFGNLLSNLATSDIKFKASHPSVIISAVTNHKDGTYSVKLTSSVEVNATVSVAYKSTSVGMSRQITFTVPASVFEIALPPAPAVSAALTSQVSGSGVPGNTVTITWPDGTKTRVLVKSDGTWSANAPHNMPPGAISVTTTDEFGNTSTAAQEMLMEGDPLPETGLKVSGAQFVGVVAMLLAGAVLLIAHHRRRA